MVVPVEEKNWGKPPGSCCCGRTKLCGEQKVKDGSECNDDCSISQAYLSCYTRVMVCPDCGARHVIDLRKGALPNTHPRGWFVECPTCQADVFVPVHNKTPGSITLRYEVLKFAELMEKKLRENDHKRTWEDLHPLDIIRAADKERDEVLLLLHKYNLDWNEFDKHKEEISGECADNANFWMMLSDLVMTL
jgi:hypothetical protein